MFLLFFREMCVQRAAVLLHAVCYSTQMFACSWSALLLWLSAVLPRCVLSAEHNSCSTIWYSTVLSAYSWAAQLLHLSAILLIFVSTTDQHSCFSCLLFWRVVCLQMSSKKIFFIWSAILLIYVSIQLSSTTAWAVCCSADSYVYSWAAQLLQTGLQEALHAGGWGSNQGTRHSVHTLPILRRHWPGLGQMSLHCHKSRPIFRDIPRSVDAQ
jgi:hypothetical protein